MKEKLNKNNFIQRAKEIHGDKYDYSKTVYIKAKEPVTIICPIHGEFTQRPQDHVLKACGCSKCKGEKVKEVHSYDKEKFLELAHQKHGNKYDYSQMNYIDYTTPITIICPKHGIIEQRPDVHIKSEGCQKCGREKANLSETYTYEQFVKKANIVHFNKYDYSKTSYINSQTIITITCPKHGDFPQTPARHLFGQGCPKCRLVGQTRLWNKLKERFPDIDILFEADKKVIPWIENQRIDIYIPSINFAIELMGQKHYEEIPYFKGGSSLEVTKERDQRKRNKCKENNCILVELKYFYTKDDFENLVLQISEKIEVGKMLTDEILHNTEDRTNLLNQVND